MGKFIKQNIYNRYGKIKVGNDMEPSEENDKKSSNNKTLEKTIERNVVPLIEKYIQGESKKTTVYAKALSKGIIEIGPKSKEHLDPESIKERLLESLNDLEISSKHIKIVEEMIQSFSEEELDELISIWDEYIYSESESIPEEEHDTTGKLLTDIDEFMAFEGVLEEQGMNTVEDFLGFVEYNPEGIEELLDIDNEELNKLIDAAKKRLSDEELKEIDDTEIKEIGKDYKLGLYVEEEEKE